jgi:hypothetical protein
MLVDTEREKAWENHALYPVHEHVCKTEQAKVFCLGLAHPEEYGDPLGLRHAPHTLARSGVLDP